MAVRRKYKEPLRFRDGGAVPLPDPAPPPETATPIIEKVDDDNALLNAIHAQRRAEELARASQAQQQAPPQDFEGRIAQFPDQAKAWLRTHPEFITDPTKTSKIGAAHNYLVENKGHTAFSPAYFDALDHEFGFKQAAPPSDRSNPLATSQPAPRRSIPITAPPSREVPMPSGQRRSETLGTLNPDERQIARVSFPDLPPAQAELQYLKNRARMHQMKAAGQIQGDG